MDQPDRRSDVMLIDELRPCVSASRMELRAKVKRRVGPGDPVIADRGMEG